LPNPSVVGQSVAFTATVAAVGSVSATPTGTVTFSEGGTALGTGTLNGGGTASFATTGLAAGIHSVTATYGSDANFAGTVSPVDAQTVIQASTTTTLTSSINSSVFTQAVIFTATVSANSPGAGTPTGTVTFKDGSST